jgi:hypothetical protein
MNVMETNLILSTFEVSIMDTIRNEEAQLMLKFIEGIEGFIRAL